MCKGNCTTCKDMDVLTKEGRSICFQCDNFSESAYLDNLISAIENGDIDSDQDVMKEYAKRCPRGKCGKRAKEDIPLVERGMIKIIEGVGTTWCVIAFVILATIPLIWPALMPTVGYLSSGYLQLVLLPLIMVGQNVSERRTEARAKIDFRAQLK